MRLPVSLRGTKSNLIFKAVGLEEFFAVDFDQCEEKRQKRRRQKYPHETVDRHASEDSQKQHDVGELGFLADEKGFEKIIDQADHESPQQKKNHGLRIVLQHQ